jgi:hypothetical protein
LAVNRREINESSFDGTVYGVVDHSVPVLWFYENDTRCGRKDCSGKIVAGVFGYAAHPSIVTTGYKYSGDYPAEAIAMLENSAYLEGTWLFITGAAGDQNIYPRGSTERCKAHAKKLADSVISTVQSGGTALHCGTSAAHAFIQLRYRVRRSRAELARWSRGRDSCAKRMAVSLLSGQNGEFTIRNATSAYYATFPIALWTICSVSIAFLGGEPTVGYSLRMKREIGVDWVAGYADDVMGYVGTRQVLSEGKREGSDRAAVYYGLPGAWSNSIEELILQEVARQARSVPLFRMCRCRC